MSVLPLEIKGISKNFGAVKALKGVGLHIAPGECLAVVGENGAGKSTLMKILAGVEQPDEGSILIDGVETVIANPRQAGELGICLVHQELIFVPGLSVVQNIFLGREESKNGFIRRSNQKTKAGELLDELGLHIDVRTKMSKISASEQQLVEIAKGLSQNAELVILDEPTSSLAPAEVERLFNVIRALLKNQKSVVYISHRVDEIGVIADRVMVMRDGQVAGTLSAGASSSEVVSLMIGRELNTMYPASAGKAGKEILAVKNMYAQELKNIGFSLHQGEILGVGGLVGAGQRTLSHVLFGIRKIKEGTISLHGENINVSKITPEYMVTHGIVYVGEDRRQEGLNLKKNIFTNMTLPVLEKFSRGGFLNMKELEKRSNGLMKKLRIRAQSIQQLA
jgi:ABC-type sugar transport system ATPase subunit